MRIAVPIATVLALFTPGLAHADLEVGFVLDTTGSMGRELREAKERVRQISKVLETARPNEVIRIGIVAYKDKGDAYVTRVSKLSADIDVSFEFLQTLSASGGGDSPEHVLAGLDAAVEQLGWSTQGKFERQVFLIGDAPPHLDYPGGVTLDQVVEKALERRIVINSVGCRSLSKSGVGVFRKIAYATEGRYQHIGGVHADQNSLSEALIDTLTRADEPWDASTSHTIDIRETRVSSPRAREAGGIRVLAEPGCGLSVAVPPGMALRGPPSVHASDDALHVRLDVERGSGAVHRLTLAECPKPNLPIQIHLGG